LKTCRDGELKRYGLAISEVVDSLTGGDFCAGRAWWVRFGSHVIYAWGIYCIDTWKVRHIFSALVYLYIVQVPVGEFDVELG